MEIAKDLDLTSKKLLILGGADVNCAVVDAAHELGAYVIVTDKRGADECPAIRIADEAWGIDFSNIESIVDASRSAAVDGVVNFCINPAQIPYARICAAVGVPCYATEEQFSIMTNKDRFKQFCKRLGIATIRQYSPEEIASGDISYPVLVKPSEGRASRGQTVCRDAASLSQALATAKSTSSDGEFIVEEYLAGEQDFALACIVIGGKVHPVKAGDRYTGTQADNLDRQHICTISPSAQYRLFEEKTLPKLQLLVDELGLSFGPLFLQGFISEGEVRFYDPDLRFPGSDFVSALKVTSGFDAAKTMVAYALTGDPNRCFGDPDVPRHGDSPPVGMLSVAVRPGIIARFDGFDDLSSDQRVVCARQMVQVGDEIPASGDVAQRACEFIVKLETREDMEAFAAFVYDTLSIEDAEGIDMIVSKFSFA